MLSELTLQPDVAAMALRLAEVLSHLSDESRYHLDSALRASEVPGIGGTLIVQLPRRVGEHPVVKWAGGAQQLSLPL